MSEFFLTQNDRAPTIRANLQDENGYVDLTGGTGYFIYKNKYTTDSPITGNADFLGVTSGYVQFQQNSGAVSTAGAYYGKWRIILSNGKQITFPNDSYIDWSVTEDLHSL